MSTISVDYDVLNQRGSPAWFTDTFANIPTAGYVGRMFISKDTFAFYRDTGTGWDLIGGPGIGTLTGSGVVGQVSFFNGTQVLAGNNNLFWDNTNSRLGINTTTPGQPLDIHSTGNTLVQLNNTTTANSNISFQNQNVAKWRVGNVYNAGANSFNIENAGLLTNALTISSTTNNITLTGALSVPTLSVTNVSTLDGNILLKKAGIGVTSPTYVSQFAQSSGVGIGYSDGTGGANFTFPTASISTYTFPASTGTIALTSDLSSYLPLTGGTLTGALVINPTNTLTIGLDVASNTTRFRSDNTEGFKRQLEIVMGSGTLVQLTAKGYLANYGTDMAFYTATTGGTNASPGIYITGTNNRVGIKTGTPSYDLDVAGTLGVSGIATFTTNVITSTYFNANNSTRDIYLNSSADLGLGPLPTIQVASNHALQFATNNTLRATLTNGGKILVNTTDTGINALLCSSASSSEPYPIGAKATTSSQGLVGFFNNSNSVIGSISYNGSVVLYNGTSDYRLKEDLKDYDALNIVKSIKTYNFKWKESKIYDYGVMAHELQEILPNIVTGKKDELDKKNNILPQAVDYSKIVPILIKAIQQLNDKLVKNNIN